MKTLYLTIFLLFLWANQCNKKTTAQQSQEIEQSVEDELPPIKEVKEIPEKGYEEFSGNQTLEGELYTSKGALLGLAGVFISEDYEAEAGNDLKPELRPLVGKKLQVKGDVYTYYCGRYEQCLTDGYIKWMRNIEFVRVVTVKK